MLRIVADFQQLMASLMAEMRDVHHRSRVIGMHLQNPARGQWFQTFTCFQYRQRTEQSKGVEDLVFVGHALQIIRLFHPVHKVVTSSPRDLCQRLV